VVEIHLDAGDDLVQYRARDGKRADRLLEPLPGGMRGGPPIDAADLLAPAGELAPLLVAVLPTSTASSTMRQKAYTA
jgi:hypothetical protein